MAERVEPSGSCTHCGRPTYGGASHCKARLCPHYAPIWARDQQRKVFENLGAFDDGEALATMYTVTAPGKDRLPWDEDRCAGLGSHRHSGLLGCRVDERLAQEWNATCSHRWRRLHDRCARLVKGSTGVRPKLLVRAFEMQTRGVLHIHAVIARGTWAQKVACDRYGAVLSESASGYGFGHVDTPTGRARAARESAAYISSYLSGGKGSKRTLHESVRSTQMPRSIIHVSTELTIKTGCTMRALRLRRMLFVKYAFTGSFPEQAIFVRQLDAITLGPKRERAPPEQEWVAGYRRSPAYMAGFVDRISRWQPYRGAGGA